MSSSPMNVLQIHASGRKEGSVTRDLSSKLVRAFAEADIAANFHERDLAEGMPQVDADWIAANFTPLEDRSADQAATLSYSDGLVDELKAADLILIGAPIYNFSIPAALKAWIDQICRARLTFKYTENGPVGLLEGKRAVILVASGGVKVGSEYDFATSYLRHVLGFIGITDVSIVAADQLMSDAENSLAKTNKDIASLIASFEDSKNGA